MFIAGGRENVRYRSLGISYHQTVDIVHQDGTTCESHDIPDLPKQLEGFGLASKNNHLIYLCGGQHRLTSSGSPCFYTCGNYLFFKYFIVEDVMIIAGGRSTVRYRAEGELDKQTLDVIHPNGNACNSSGLPDIPESLEGFGMASKKDRIIYICGGMKKCLNCRTCSGTPCDCFTACGMYGQGHFIFDSPYFWSIHIVRK